jgi:uncharacterized protein involved in exopolysaccharide biosynthesis
MPSQQLQSEAALSSAAAVGDEITLSELLRVLRIQKWFVIAISVTAAAISVTYALLAPQWYRAEITLVPAKQRTGSLTESLGALGGLAGIAGIDLRPSDSTEPIAVLKSRGFTREFIDENDLLPLLFADQWDKNAKQWRADQSGQVPDLRDGERLFSKSVRSVFEDPSSGLITVSIEWTDPVLAARWANLLVGKLNQRMRKRALQDAEYNIEYLRTELAKSSIVAIQESLSRLLEREMQKLMIARGSSEYSFRVVDAASPPKWRSKPNRVLVCILGTGVGVIFAVVLAVVRLRSSGAIGKV